MEFKATALGFEIWTPQFLFFFGKKESGIENLKAAYPQFRFLKIHQVHGDAIIQQTSVAPSELPKADGHVTSLPGTALVVVTADCSPILLAHAPSHTMMALHAGWRGVAARIFPKGLRLLKSLNILPQELFVFLGPHIQQASFEVGADVKDQLLASVPSLDSATAEQIARPLAPANPDKFLVDLNSLIKFQAAEFEIPADQLFDLHLDTFADQRFHSFRRDKEKSGRQLSFIASLVSS